MPFDINSLNADYPPGRAQNGRAKEEFGALFFRAAKQYII